MVKRMSRSAYRFAETLRFACGRGHLENTATPVAQASSGVTVALPWFGGWVIFATTRVIAPLLRLTIRRWAERTIR